MEWMIIPGILLLLSLVSITLKVVTKDWLKKRGITVSPLLVILCISLSLFLTAIICCPINYYSRRNAAIEAEAYYTEIIIPHKVAECDDYIEVQSLESGVWQAGEMNLAHYNAYLKTTRYWDSISVIGTVIYPPPEHLKFVRVYQGT